MLLLVRSIKGLTFKFYVHKHLPHVLYDNKRYFYRYFHTGQTTNQKYLETFKNKVSFIDTYGGSIGTDPGLDKEESAGVANLTDPNNQSAATAATRKYLGFLMI